MSPFNSDAEKGVVGYVLRGGKKVGDVFDALSPSDFYVPAHAAVFDAAKHVWQAGTQPDTVSVAARLESVGDIVSVGGTSALISLLSAGSLDSTVESHVGLVVDAALKRRLLSVSVDIGELAKSSFPAVEAIGSAERMVFDLAAGSTEKRGFVRAGLGGTIEAVSDMWVNGHVLRGASTGFSSLDSMISGFEGSKFYILAARPAMGKSALGLNLAANIAVGGVPVAFFSLEMQADELNQRLLSSLSGVSQERLMSGRLVESDWVRIAAAARRIDESCLIVDDDGMVTVDEVFSRCRRIKTQYGGLGLVVVDYLQLMSGEGENRQLEISYISRRLKVMAKELDTPVLALSQLNRGVESRQSKRPMLSDLRESGSLEQDSNVVMFIYRDEVYDPESDWVGMPELIVAKNRAGSTGSVRLGFVDAQTRFCELSREG